VVSSFDVVPQSYRSLSCFTLASPLRSLALPCLFAFSDDIFMNLRAWAGLHGNVAVEVSNLFSFSASPRLCHYSTYARGRR
jgi:hypothetical protein